MEVFLTRKEAAERLGVSIKTITRRIKDGSLVAVRLSDNLVRIEESELQKYIDGHRTTGV